MPQRVSISAATLPTPPMPTIATWAFRQESCQVICLRSGVDLSRHPEGPSQLLYPDAVHETFWSRGTFTEFHDTTSMPYHTIPSGRHSVEHIAGPQDVTSGGLSLQYRRATCSLSL